MNNYFTFISSLNVLAEHHIKVQLQRDRSGLKQADTFFYMRWMCHILYGLQINMAHEIMKFRDHILYNITHFQRKFTDFKYDMKLIYYLIQLMHSFKNTFTFKKLNC